MKTVQEFLCNTPVIIVDDDTGYYIRNPETEERLDIRFNTVREAVKYAFSEYLVIAWIDLHEVDNSPCLPGSYDYVPY